MTHDVIVIGSGVCGLYALYRLRSQGKNVLVLERNSDLGGTWYRNRYPGCRFDSESYSYSYSFSRELLQEWDWTERFSPQPENLRYLNHVADKVDLRANIQFDSRVVAATWDEQGRCWTVVLEDGRTYTAPILMTAIGLLSKPTSPAIEGIERFTGDAFHTYDWPQEGYEVAGKRVAVIGTGATGVQVIQTIADQVESLTVLQRTANWCAPLNNSPISAAEMEHIKASYDEIFERCRQTPGGFIHGPDPRRTLEVSPQEREAFWEELYASPGFGIWLGNFRDTIMDEKANALLSEFIARKVRERVGDPVVAETLIPTDHGFGSRRVPLETRYYEVYNRDNVELVDLKATPIVEATPAGLRTTEREYEFDLIVYATGFDAITGPYESMEIRGAGGRLLSDKWEAGPTTYLGVQTVGFPNFITLLGPQGGSVSSNYPRSIEEIVDWSTGLLQYMAEHDLARVEPKQKSEDEWVAHVADMATRVLLSKAKSWFTGYNSNVARKSEAPRNLIYTGGAVRFRRWLDGEIADGYPGFDFA
jgi:cation diffusion facilitator CzcD-associated flavoprotein CzcO